MKIYEFYDYDSGVNALFDSKEKAENFAQQVKHRTLTDYSDFFHRYNENEDYLIREHEINPNLDEWWDETFLFVNY